MQLNVVNKWGLLLHSPKRKVQFRTNCQVLQLDDKPSNHRSAGTDKSSINSMLSRRLSENSLGNKQCRGLLRTNFFLQCVLHHVCSSRGGIHIVIYSLRPTGNTRHESDNRTSLPLSHVRCPAHWFFSCQVRKQKKQSPPVHMEPTKGMFHSSKGFLFQGSLPLKSPQGNPPEGSSKGSL